MFGYKSKKFFIALFIACFFASFTLAVASSDGGDHSNAPTKGWVKEDTYRVINFAVLAGALFFVLRKPVSNALNGRIESIKKELDDLEQKKEEAKTKLADYKEKIASFEKEKEKIVANYKKQAELSRDKIIKEAQDTAIKLETQAKRNIENEFKVAKAELKKEIAEEALLKAEEIIKKSVSKEDEERLLAEYIDKVA